MVTTSTDLIIPGKSLVELARIIGESDPEIKVNPGETKFYLKLKYCLLFLYLMVNIQILIA